MEKGNRVYYLDILRVIACLSVIMIHSSANYVVKDIGTFNFWIGNILNGVSRIGVPLFVMISGALMLDGNYQCSLKKIERHIERMILFFCFWSTVYCVIFDVVVRMLIKHESIKVTELVISLINGPLHLWFVYLIIGLYLIIPLLRLWINEDNKKHIEYYIILSIIFTFLIPQIIDIGGHFSNSFGSLSSIINKLSLNYVGGYTAYLIIGWYINKFEFKKNIYIVGGVGLIITTIGTYILSSVTGKAVQMHENLSVNVLFQSVAVFILVKNRFGKVQKENNDIICSISRHSLGIYAIHFAIIRVCNKIVERINIDSALAVIPVIFLVVFLLSYLSSYIISNISFLKKVV